MKVNDLRRFGMYGTISLIAIAFLATIAGLLGWWVAVTFLVHAALVGSVVVVLSAGRYVANLIRTETRRLVTLNDHLSYRIEELFECLEGSNVQANKSDNGLKELNYITNRTVAEARDSILGSVSIVKDEVGKVGGVLSMSARQNKQHVTSTVRDGTRQIEALVQIYSRFPEMKLPMPSTGGFAIDSQALAHLVALVEDRRPKRILELGSGTSTIWLGYLAQRFGGQVVTLDHLERYLELTRTAVNRHGLSDRVECRLAPLEKLETDGEQYSWYAPSALGDLDDVDLVVIDGPPAATGPKARYPALPNIIELLAPHATVILDDAHRKDESDIVDSWLSTFTNFEQIEHGTSRLAVLERKQ